MKNLSQPDSGSDHLSHQDLKVLASEKDYWEVEALFPTGETSESQLAQKFKEIKKLLVEKFLVPERIIKYDSILGRRNTERGIVVRLKIAKLPLGKGAPAFHIRAAESPEGISFNDMVCYADFYFLDEFEKELIKNRILNELSKKEISDILIDHGAIDQALEKLKVSQDSLKEVKVAEGIFPDSGEEAEIEFYFQGAPDLKNLEEYIASRKVTRGSLLCSKKRPRAGIKKGMTVFGREIPPMKGYDIDLNAGKNVHISVEKTHLTAKIDGFVQIDREEKMLMTPEGMKLVPSKITVSLEPVESAAPPHNDFDLATYGSSTIKGSIKNGSKVVYDGEVHVEGDISDNANMQATHDIVIGGSVSSGKLASDKNIVVRKNVDGGDISAGQNLVIKGKVSDSKISGREIYAHQINGGQVTAEDHLCVNVLGRGKGGECAVICIGTATFLERKIKENEEFIEEVLEMVERLKELFGEEMISEVRSDNVQQLFFQFLKQPKAKEIAKDKINDFKKLLSAVHPLRRIIREKKREIRRLQKRLEGDIKSEKTVVIKEKVKARSTVIINETTRFLRPQDGPLKLNEEILKTLEEVGEDLEDDEDFLD